MQCLIANEFDNWRGRPISGGGASVIELNSVRLLVALYNARLLVVIAVPLLV